MELWLCEEWWWSSQDNLNSMYSLGIMVDSITHILLLVHICMVTFNDGVLLIFNRANNNTLVKLVIVMPISCCLLNLIVRHLCVNCAFWLSQSNIG